MSGSNGRACPECGAPRRPDGTPSCACTQRASDAFREARTAEAAAAEDFDPLRIRPYVELGSAAREDTVVIPPDGTLRRPAVPAQGGGSGTGPDAPDASDPPAAAEAGTAPVAAAEARTAPGAPGEADAALRPGSVPDANGGADETVQLGAVPDANGGADETVQLGAVPDAPLGPEPPDGEPPRRRRRAVLPAAGGAVVAVAAAAGFAGGLFSYHPPQRDTALPDAIRASVPEGPSPGGTSGAASTTSAPATATRTTPPPSTSPSSSASTSSASATPSVSATPSRTTTAQATPSVSPSPDSGSRRNRAQTQVLRQGDEGPEVEELQLRLRELNLYVGPVDGVYDDQVENSVRTYQLARGVTQDDPGVYGPATRAALESETSEP
ncbi:peptidoglycan-binding protein [Streptomyces sp. NPDC046931]|uniref:peptidoglycan-binding protein n=1 Tax=Streptomyces sp. NPDC046931 TaxID=3154806 RepID=UPI0033E9848E